MKKYLALGGLVLLLGAGCLAPAPSPAPAPAPDQSASSTDANPNLRNVSVKRGAAVSSPLEVTGEAKLWYFEASFPVKLYDASGNLLASAPAQAQGDWMTEDFVPFKVSLSFTIPGDEDGTLELKNDNPSGDPARDQIVRIPVKLRTSAPPALE